jgi:hypothetical protein
MSVSEKRVLRDSRRRKIPSTGFSWIDRRFLRDGFLREVNAQEALLYFFLCAAADKDGLSVWGDRRISMLLKLPETSVDRARMGLIDKDLVLYQAPIWQVLSVPDHPIGPGITGVLLPAPTQPATDGPQPVSDLLRRFL